MKQLLDKQKLLSAGDRFSVFGVSFEVLKRDKETGEITCVTVEPWRNDSFDKNGESDFYKSEMRYLLAVFIAKIVESKKDLNLIKKQEHGELARLMTKDELQSVHFEIRLLAWTMEKSVCKRYNTKMVVAMTNTGLLCNTKPTSHANIYPVIVFSKDIIRHLTFKPE